MSEVLRSSVKDKLAAGGVVSSMTVRLVPSVDIVQIIKSAGFDTFYIDLEHSPISIETANNLASAASPRGNRLFRPCAGEHAGLRHARPPVCTRR